MKNTNCFLGKEEENSNIMARLISPVYLENSRFSRRKKEKFSDFSFCDGLVEFDKIKTCVYFVSNGEYTKIGYTRNMKKRIRALQGGANPQFLKLLFVMQFQNEHEAILCETFFHRLFFEKQVCGEWFDICDHDMIDIKPKIKNRILKVIKQERNAVRLLRGHAPRTQQ